MEQIKNDTKDSLGSVEDPVTQAARSQFGIPYLYPWQRLVIANILDAAASTDDDTVCRGKQIVLLPTGSGKSLCFLLPALLLQGPTLIIYPLLALMADQQRRMEQNGIASVTFRGQQTVKEREENFRKLYRGTKIILANPEVLQNRHLVTELSKCNITHIAVDEAHCVSEWGDSFRPAYLKLASVFEQLQAPVITAFTATASPPVLDRISEVLFGGSAHIVRSESDRPAISYYVNYSYAKKKEIIHLAVSEQRPMLVFCGTRHNAEDMARELRAYFETSDCVRFYHAGLAKEEKKAVETWFLNGKDLILCATCAYGMGIDKKDIRTVVHMDPPPSIESYIQETGRAARDNKPAKAILLWNYDDHKKFSSFPPGSRQRALYNFAEAGRCRRQILLEALGATDAASAVCSGCDICEAEKAAKLQGKTEFHIPSLADAEDAAFVLHYIRCHRTVLTEQEAETELLKQADARDRTVCGINIWDRNDIAGIIEQLKKENRIQLRRFPWKNRLDTSGK